MQLSEKQKEFIKKRLEHFDDATLFDAIVKYIYTIPSMMTIFQLQWKINHSRNYYNAYVYQHKL